MSAHGEYYLVNLSYLPEVATTSADNLRTTQSPQKKARELEDCGSDAPLQWSKQEMSAASEEATKTFGDELKDSEGGSARERASPLQQWSFRLMVTKVRNRSKDPLC